MSVKTVRTYICNGCHQEIAVCQARDLDHWRTVETHWSGAVYCEHTHADDFTHYCPSCWAKMTAALKDDDGVVRGENAVQLMDAAVNPPKPTQALIDSMRGTQPKQTEPLAVREVDPREPKFRPNAALKEQEK